MQQFGREAQELQGKWKLKDKDFLAWGASIAGHTATCQTAMYNSCVKGINTVRNADAVATASVIGVINALYANIRQLPAEEATFVMGEINRQMMETVDYFKYKITE